MAAIQPAAVRAITGLRLIPVSARGCQQRLLSGKVALNPRTPWGRVFGFFVVVEPLRFLGAGSWIQP